MFLAQLDSAIAQSLRKQILTRFGANPAASAPTAKRWKELIDIDVRLQRRRRTTLKKIAEDGLLKDKPSASEVIVGGKPLKGMRSALLFGPPGTSKTSLAEVVAERLGWPLLVVTPSDFLSKGLEQIYVRANEIFDDLFDISATVVLFDEMDALVQTRENPNRKKDELTAGLDVTRQMLTTSMLPKLAGLHKRAQVIFFMATNHRRQLDPAITRSGRFDLLLCVGPPRWNRKLAGLARIVEKVTATDISRISKRLRELASSSKTKRCLDRFTVSDLRVFLHYLGEPHKLAVSLEKQPKEGFEALVSEWTEKYITINKDLLEEFEEDFQASRRQ
jgi:SpoVK/Ycf46/Vps4 family AAA+-type ATPase